MLGQVRDRVKAYAANRWTALGSYRDADIERFIATVVPIVEAGQKQTAQLTVAYLDSLARMSGFAPAGAAMPITGDVIRGVAMAEVYKRPGVTVWTALADGKSITDAVGLGAKRVEQLIDMDLQLAQTHNARNYFGRAAGVVGYMRVLGGGNNCALCALASTQRYHRGNLLPIHEHCHCSVVSLYGDHDPGQVINIERYGAMQQLIEDANVTHPGLAAGSKWEKSNKPNSHIRVNMHGEYGPTLSWADQNFTSAADLGI